MKPIRETYGSWAVVTGASGGIGLEFASELAKQGVSVVLVARRGPALDAIANDLQQLGVGTRTVIADLTTPQGIASVIDATSDLDVGVLVNNAGREDDGRFLDVDVDRALGTARLNVLAPLALTHHFARSMKEKRRGAVIFMSSVVAFQGVPYIANYAATKAYDLVLAEGLAAELTPYGVDVLAVAPGFTATDLAPDLDLGGLPLRPMAPAAVVRDALGALGKRRLVIPGLANKFLYYTGKFFQPRRLASYAFGLVFGRALRGLLTEGSSPPQLTAPKKPSHTTAKGPTHV